MFNHYLLRMLSNKKSKLSQQGRPSGFTLLEVLVGLTILAITLGAVLRIARDRTETLESLKLRTFAHWVAQNKYAEFQMNPEMITASSGEAYQAGLLFIWTAEPGELSTFSKARPVRLKVTDSARQPLITRQQWIFPPVTIDAEHLPSENPPQHASQS